MTSKRPADFALFVKTAHLYGTAAPLDEAPLDEAPLDEVGGNLRNCPMRFFAPIIIAFLSWAPLCAQADDAALSLAANQAFLAANAKKPGMVSLPNGLQYRVLKTGFGVRPGLTDTVQLHFTGKLINGTVFDGTSPGLPATVAVNGVIRGLSQALQMMHVGDHWLVVMPTELAYGAAGAGAGRVPPNQALQFDVTLVASIPTSAPDAPPADSFSILSANEERKAVLTLHP